VLTLTLRENSSLEDKKNRFFSYLLCISNMQNMPVNGFCNIQNVKAIYDLLNEIGRKSNEKEKRKKNSNAANLFSE